jgi:hypothetical protein
METSSNIQHIIYLAFLEHMTSYNLHAGHGLQL